MPLFVRSRPHLLYLILLSASTIYVKINPMKIPNPFTLFSRQKSIIDQDRGWRYIFSNSDLSVSEIEGIVYKCIDFIGQNLAAVPIYHVTQASKDLPKSDFLNLLNSPNTYLGYEDLVKMTVYNYMRFGACYWWIDEDKITFISGSKGKPNHEQGAWSRLTYTTNGGQKTIDMNDVIMFVCFNPEDPLSVISPIEKMRYEILNEKDANQHNRAVFDNSVNPSGVLSFKGELSQEIFQQAVDKFNSQYAGSKKSGKVIFTDTNSDFKPLAISNKDLEYTEGRKFTRDNILAMFGVPKPLLFTDEVNYANSRAAYDHFMTFTLHPLSTWFSKRLSHYVESHDQGTKIMSPDLRSRDREYDLKLAQTGVNVWLSIDEARELTGYKLDGTANKSIDPLLINKSMVQKKSQRQLAIELDRLREATLSQVGPSYKKKFAKLFERVIAKIGDNVKTLNNVAKGVELYDPDLEKWQEEYGEEMYDENKEIMEKSLKNTDKVYGTKLFATIGAGLGILALLQSRNAAKQIRDSMKDDVKTIYDEAVKSGLSEPKAIKDFIKGKLTDQKDYRVDRVMRTETLKSYQKASWYGYSKLKVEGVVWDALDDACATCQQNDKEVRKMGEAFPTGDYSEPAHPNCRCITIPELPEE